MGISLDKPSEVLQLILRQQITNAEILNLIKTGKTPSDDEKASLSLALTELNQSTGSVLGIDREQTGTDSNARPPQTSRKSSQEKNIQTQHFSKLKNGTIDRIREASQASQLLNTTNDLVDREEWSALLERLLDVPEGIDAARAVAEDLVPHLAEMDEQTAALVVLQIAKQKNPHLINDVRKFIEEIPLAKKDLDILNLYLKAISGDGYLSDKNWAKTTLDNADLRFAGSARSKIECARILADPAYVNEPKAARSLLEQIEKESSDVNILILIFDVSIDYLQDQDFSRRLLQRALRRSGCAADIAQICTRAIEMIAANPEISEERLFKATALLNSPNTLDVMELSRSAVRLVSRSGPSEEDFKYLEQRLGLLTRH